jgi:hypothetical protein
MVEIVLDRNRQHTLVHERPNRPLNQTLLVCKLEIHARSLLASTRIPWSKPDPGSATMASDPKVVPGSRASSHRHRSECRFACWCDALLVAGPPSNHQRAQKNDDDAR